MAALPENLTHLDPQTRLLARSILFLFGSFLSVENRLVLTTTPGPVIYALNHNNYWETLLVGSYLVTNRTGEKLAFIADWMFGRLPLFRWLLKRIDPIYTYRKTARFAVLDKYRQKIDAQAVCQACLERLHHGQSLGVFPEGARNNNPYQLKRGRKGVGEIALRSGVPVLPMGIDFPQRIRKGRIPWFSPIILRIGLPLSFPEECAASQAINRDTRLSPLERQRLQVFLSARLTHRIMLELARLSGKEYPFSAPRISSQAKSYLEKTTGRGVLL
jgi:1-acyl-sn-glycerol-3-phosphate acyltransferase